MTKTKQRMMLAAIVLAALFEVGGSKAILAQETPPMHGIEPRGESTQKIEEVSGANLYDGKIISQENRELSIAFNIKNMEKAQSGLKYTVFLMSQDRQLSGAVAERVYDETLSLGANELVEKKISYEAPEFLTGTYNVWLKLTNSNSYLISVAMIGKAELKGMSDFVSINENSCLLNIVGDINKNKYDILEGVDISTDEKLVAICEIENKFKEKLSVTPHFETHYRSVVGKMIGEEDQSPISLEAGKKKQLEFNLPKVSIPQAYEVVLTLKNQEGKVVSNSINFHYVLQGASATIQSLQLDKDYYAKGEVAKANLFWTPSADSFPGARRQQKAPDKIFLTLNMKNAKGDQCSDTIKKELTMEKSSIEIEIPVLADCPNPTLSVSLTDSGDKILDQQEIINQSSDIQIRNAISSQLNNKDGKQGKYNKGWMIFLAGAILLGALAVLAVLKIKKKNMPTLLTAFFIAGGLLFSTGSKVEANTFHVYTGDCWFYGINKEIYDPGEDVIASFSADTCTCSNIWLMGNVRWWIDDDIEHSLWVPMHNRVTNSTQLAPLVPGLHKAHFEFFREANLIGSGEIPFTVRDTATCIDPTPVASVCPNPVRSPGFEDYIDTWVDGQYVTNFYSWGWFGWWGVYRVVDDNGSKAITMRKLPWNGSWLFQPYFTLKPNHQYKLTFDARSNYGSDITVKFKQHQEPYTEYMPSQKVHLSTSSTKHTINFKTNDFGNIVQDAALIFAWDSANTTKIPGRVEMEDYRRGGPGVAYYDTTPGGTWFYWRWKDDDTGRDDVDVEPAYDWDGGQHITTTAAGEWTTYDINVEKTGRYTLIPRVSSWEDGEKSFHFEVDGVNITGTVSFTDNQSDFIRMNLPEISINLTAGAHVLKFYVENGNFQINHVSIQYPGGWAPSSEEYYFDNVSICDSDPSALSEACPPSLNFSASKLLVPYGGSTDLIWSTEHVARCTATNGWNGNKKAEGGSETIHNITGVTTFELECWNAAEQSTGKKSLTVVVTATGNCGDGILGASEECDDGMSGNGDCPKQCSADCKKNNCQKGLWKEIAP